jgi:uncharacterized protein YoxC
MQAWQIVAMVCAVAVTAALVWALVGLGRMLRRADGVLAIVEQELRPLIGQANGLTEEIRTLTRETHREVERIGVMTDRLGQTLDGVARLVTSLGALTRAGQVVGLASAVRRGVDVFVQRMKQGDHHGG